MFFDILSELVIEKYILYILYILFTFVKTKIYGNNCNKKKSDRYS